ncbi:MAG: hypothetical protein ACP5E5_08045 [Acidobacteriaceae bacterium]
MNFNFLLPRSAAESDRRDRAKFRIKAYQTVANSALIWLGHSVFVAAIQACRTRDKGGAGKDLSGRGAVSGERRACWIGVVTDRNDIGDGSWVALIEGTANVNVSSHLGALLYPNNYPLALLPHREG